MKVQDFVMQLNECQGSLDGKVWHPVRCKTSENTFWTERIKAAWRVLMGRADVIDWGDWE